MLTHGWAAQHMLTRLCARLRPHALACKLAHACHHPPCEIGSGGIEAGLCRLPAGALLLRVVLLLLLVLRGGLWGLLRKAQGFSLLLLRLLLQVVQHLRRAAEE